MMNADTTTPTQRESLSPRTIVEAAVALADSQGLDAVTIRRVASALDVTPMALYWHFRNKDELMAGMADWVFGAMDVDLDPGAPWHERFRGLLEAEIEVLRAHPALAPLVLTHGGMGKHILPMIETALGILFDAGFTPTEAVQIVQYAEQTVVNLVIREQRLAASIDQGEMSRREQDAADMLRTLPEAKFGNVHLAAEPLSRCEDPGQYYAFGLDLLLSGVEAMARRGHSGG